MVQVYASGRIVWGHPLRARDKTDNDGKVIRDEKGQTIPQWSFGLAIPKQMGWAEVQAAMSQAATGIPGNNLPNFAWKVKDGDTALDKEGRPLNAKPGHAGCMILAISTEAGSGPKVFRRTGATDFAPMTVDEIKTGDFVRVKLDIVGHGVKPGTRGANPGLYLNPLGLEFVGYGDAIFSGESAQEMFGTLPVPVLPPGASATPIGTVAAPAPIQPAPMAPAPMPGGPPAPVALPPGYPSPTPAAPVTPGPIAPGAGPPVAPLAAPAPAPVMAPVPTVSPSSPAPVAPARDFVANAAGRTPVAFDPTTGKPIYGYQQGTNRPIFGYDPSGQWAIYGWDAAGNPIYQ